MSKNYGKSFAYLTKLLVKFVRLDHYALHQTTPLSRNSTIKVSPTIKGGQYVSRDVCNGTCGCSLCNKNVKFRQTVRPAPTGKADLTPFSCWMNACHLRINLRFNAFTCEGVKANLRKQGERTFRSSLIGFRR